MDGTPELEIREEARFVLWALRCCVSARMEGESYLYELAQGFEVADVAETRAVFCRFAEALQTHARGTVTWHGPRCGCVSFGELFVLQAMATASERLKESGSEPAPWWNGVVEANATLLVDGLARQWLEALENAGIIFPRPAELVVSLAALEQLVGPAFATVH